MNKTGKKRRLFGDSSVVFNWDVNFFIDFQNPAFQDGLFAITGNTGSGKSTILDSITLAIFGFIPRLGGEVTITDISQLGGVVTHGEKQSFAEIDYEVKGKVYRSNWSININRNGNWNLPDDTVIIFDEATSALDSETESTVMEAIEGLGEHLTVLIIAHRVTTLKQCTQIVELSNGGIKRVGSYQQIVGVTK